MIGDTTPIMQMLDGRVPKRQMYPDGPEGVLVQVVEEYFDEWVARTMVHYRWHYPESAEFASQIMADGNPAIAERMLSWGPRACRATGTDSDVQRKAAETTEVATPIPITENSAPVMTSMPSSSLLPIIGTR